LTEYDPKRGVSVATLAYEYPSRYQGGYRHVVHFLSSVSEFAIYRKSGFVVVTYAFYRVTKGPFVPSLKVIVSVSGVSSI
jgi:hypothetical protein